MKYKIGDKIHMMNGEKCTVISMRNQLFDFRYYLIKDKNGDEFLFEMSGLESISYSEKEWQEKQQRESFKFKVGDKIFTKIASHGLYYYHISGLDLNRKTYFLTSLNSNTFGETTYVSKIIIERDFELLDCSRKSFILNKQHIPSKNEQYFFADICDENLFGIATWLSDATDFHMLKLGLIKETPQECVKLAKAMLKKLEFEV